MKQIHDVLEYGAIGDGAAMDTLSIQTAIDACEDKGGIVLLGGRRTFRAGTLFLKKHVTLRIENGSALKASDNIGDFEHKAFLYAKEQPGIRVEGGGIIDGNQEAFLKNVTRYHKSGIEGRPWMFCLDSCDNLTFCDITLQNAPAWTLHIVGCKNVLIHGIRINNDLAMANSDGIDIDHCRNVTVTGCHISCADDCIVVKNTRARKDYGPCENIIVTGCTMTSTSAAFKIGSETVSDFKRIIVADCIVTRTNRALGIQLRDEGNVEDVVFRNIIIETRRFYDRYWGKAEPIYITALSRDGSRPSGGVKNVSCSNIIARSENGIYLHGEKNHGEYNISDVELRDIRLRVYKESKWQGGIYDPRPSTICNTQLWEEGNHWSPGLIYTQTNGVFVKGVKGISLHNVSVSWEGTEEYYGEDFHYEDSDDII